MDKIVLSPISGGLGNVEIYLGEKNEFKKEDLNYVFILESKDFKKIQILRNQFVLAYTYLNQIFPNFNLLSKFQTKTLLGKKNYTLFKRIKPCGVELL